MSNHRTSAFYDRSAVAQSVEGASSVVEALDRLGYKPGNSNYRRLREACERYRLTYPARKPRSATKMAPASKSKIRDREALRSALAEGTSMYQVIKLLGVATSKKNYDSVTRACHEFGFVPPALRSSGRKANPAARFTDRDAFVSAAAASPSTTRMLVALGRPRDWVWAREAAAFYRVQLPHGTTGAGHGGGRPIPLEALLVEGSTRRGASLKQRLIDEGLIEDICSECGLGPTWNGEPITLQLDHISGDRTDNRLENLRVLCPNCHSQTDTWTGRNTRRVLLSSVPAGASYGT